MPGSRLIFFAIILFIAEVKIMSHGLLAIGGVISLFLGSVMLISSPFRIGQHFIKRDNNDCRCRGCIFHLDSRTRLEGTAEESATGFEGMIGEEGS